MKPVDVPLNFCEFFHYLRTHLKRLKGYVQMHSCCLTSIKWITWSNLKVHTLTSSNMAENCFRNAYGASSVRIAAWGSWTGRTSLCVLSQCKFWLKLLARLCHRNTHSKLINSSVQLVLISFRTVQSRSFKRKCWTLSQGLDSNTQRISSQLTRLFTLSSQMQFC